jgi:hypothetical protein
MQAAVKWYQSRLGLPVTSRLDPATLGRITSPRCGVSDGRGAVVMSDSAASRFTFFDGEPRWTGPGPIVLTYSVSSAATVSYLPPEAVRAAFRSAFARWAKVIPVEFVEIDEDYSYHEADVRVGFYEGDHGDGSPFDGEKGVVAHAYGPEDGRLHLDAAEHWTLDVDSETEGSALDLESVATRDRAHPRARALVVAGGGRVPVHQLRRKEGGAQRRRHRGRSAAVRAQPAVQARATRPLSLRVTGKKKLAWFS